MCNVFYDHVVVCRVLEFHQVGMTGLKRDMIAAQVNFASTRPLVTGYKDKYFDQIRSTAR